MRNFRIEFAVPAHLRAINKRAAVSWRDVINALFQGVGNVVVSPALKDAAVAIMEFMRALQEKSWIDGIRCYFHVQDGRMVDERATLHREMLDPDDYFRHSHSHYQRLQFRRMYRYGLALLLVGALCNWIGFAQHSFAPIRYLGVGCVLAGALCICIALCRWLAIRHTDVSQPQVIKLLKKPNNSIENEQTINY